MIPGPARGALRLALSAVVAGGAAGVLARVAVPLRSADAGPDRAFVALVLVLVAVTVAGAGAAARDESRGAALRRVGVVCSAAVVAGLVAVLVAGGGATALAGALVPAACCVLAAGAARATQRLAGAASATVIGALVPAALTAALFVADPFIEWRGSTGGATGRAHAVFRVNPLAALSDGTGAPWLTRPLVYDGPDPTSAGLSAVGQYYPTSPPGALPWSAAVALVGVLLLLTSGGGGVRRA